MTIAGERILFALAGLGVIVLVFATVVGLYHMAQWIL
jgi:hypothetical protein